MAGIYIHVPFCKKACHYCNFHFSTSTRHINDVVKAIVAEARLRKNYITEAVDTIYFGGGTPSILAAEQTQQLLAAMKENFMIFQNAEVTIEANPDDITEEKLLQWKTLGVNRLSVGVQSFFDHDLQWMNRAHNASQAIKSIELAQQNGFTNITIDLIYGTPTLNDEQWHKNVQTALALNVPHLSCYALTVEPKTALDKLIQQHKIENVDTEKQGRHFELLMRWLREAGYEHYEISNFAKPGYRSLHNSSYWQGKPYVGLGPSAHSFNGDSRQWNVANNALYVKSIEQQMVPFEIEYLTKEQQLNEYIMTSLRTTEGLSIDFVQQHFNGFANAISYDAQKWIDTHHIIDKNNRFVLTDKGKLFADGIAADLFR